MNDYRANHLHEIGEKVRQKDWGTFTLLKRIKVNKIFEISPMNITINEIRIIKLSNMNNQTKELLSQYTGLSVEEAFELYNEENLSNEALEDKVASSRTEIGKDITYFEIDYSVKNTSSKELQFFSMETVTFNKNMTYIVPEKNFIYSDDTLIGTRTASRVDYTPNETRNGIIGLLNETGENTDKITSMSFSTDDILDGDTHNLLAKSKTFQIKLQ